MKRTQTVSQQVGGKNGPCSAHARLKLELEELKQAFDCSPVHLAVIDDELRLVRINSLTEETLGLSADAVVGHQVSEVMPPNLARQFESECKRVLTSEESHTEFELEGRTRGTDGQTRCWLVSLQRLEGAEYVKPKLLASATDITERKRADEDLLLKQFALDHAPDAVYWIDREARFFYVNEAACKSLGYAREELLQLTVPQIDPTWPVDKWDELWEINRAKGTTAPFETVHQTRDGRLLPVEITAAFIEYGGRVFDCAYARDITERKRAQEALQNANRMLAAISRVNEILVRAAREEELLTEVCRAVVELGGYMMVWVGYAESDARKTVRPVAHAGFEDGYLTTVSISWAEDELGQGPVGRAIRSGAPAAVDDLRIDPSYAPWRDEAMRRGYVCSVALPLVTDGRTIGALSLYRQEPGYFNASEERLLSQLASDLSYGIASLRARDERAAAEAERRALEHRLEEHKRKFYRETILSVTNGKLSICEPTEVRPYVARAQLSIDVRQVVDVALARRAVEAFCRAQGLEEEALAHFMIGVGEAVTNAVKHAGRGRVYAGVNSEIWVAVRDLGSGIESLILPSAVLRRGFSTKPSLGLGYTIMLDAADRILLKTGMRGTTVVLLKSLQHRDTPPLEAIPDTWETV